MNWDRLIAITSMLLDAGILIILIIEFDYDKTVYEKEQYKKISRRKKSFTLPEEKLTTGEMQ